MSVPSAIARQATVSDLTKFFRQQNLPIPAELGRGTLKVLVVDERLLSRAR